MIVFKHKIFSCKPNIECLVDEDFEPLMKLFCDKAAQLGLNIYGNSFFRENSKHIQGAIVPPANMSNHFVAHAADINIIHNNIWLNTIELVKKNQNAMLLIQYAKSINLRWGGEFNTPDFVHFDSGLNIHDPEKWHLLYNKYHFKNSQDEKTA